MSLINFENIPGNQFSGLSDDILQFVTDESGDRFITELTDEFRNELDNFDNLHDYQSLDGDQLNLLEKLEMEAIPPGTNNQTKRHTEMFRNFLSSKGLSKNFEKAPSKILCDYLRLFYANARTKTGELYAPSSLICIRASIHRHLTSVEVNRNINILQGDDFRRANAVLKAMIGLYLRSGQSKERKYDPIQPADMEKLNSFFDRSNDRRIQQEVLFNLIYYFGLRGRENLRFLKTDTFSVKCDSDSREYISLDKTLVCKNVKSSLSKKDFCDKKDTRVYAIEDKRKCPVQAFKLYMSRLPQSTHDNTLFPKPVNAGFSKLAVLGKETLGNFMKDLSKECKLSQSYTNHCIRVTTVNVMKEQGCSDDQISFVTGHKNSSSIIRYCRNRTDERYLTSSLALSAGKEKSCTIIQDEKVLVMKRKSSGQQDETSSEKTVHLTGPFNNCTFNF